MTPVDTAKSAIDQADLTELQAVTAERNALHQRFGQIAHERMDLDTQEKELKDDLARNIKSFGALEQRLIRKYNLSENVKVDINSGVIA